MHDLDLVTAVLVLLGAVVYVGKQSPLGCIPAVPLVGIDQSSSLDLDLDRGRHNITVWDDLGIDDNVLNTYRDSPYAIELINTLTTMYSDIDEQIIPQSIPGLDQVQFHPITFAVPEHQIQIFPPAKAKAFAENIPGDPSTYVFIKWNSPLTQREREYNYKLDMERSWFAVTWKKYGWDCLRHLEIMASGALPLMTDVAQAPPGVMTRYPNKVFAKLLSFPGVNLGAFQHQSGPFPPMGMKYTLQFDEQEANNKPLYWLTVHCLLAATRRYLSTRAIASYVLDVMGMKRVRSVLFLVGEAYNFRDINIGDYQVIMLLHGLKLLFGDNVVDYPKQTPLLLEPHGLHEKEWLAAQHNLYGQGFTFARHWYELPGQIDRTDLRTRIRNREFDMVIFAPRGRGIGPFQQHFGRDVCQSYPPTRVGVIHGADLPPRPDIALQYASCSHFQFSRELY